MIENNLDVIDRDGRRHIVFDSTIKPVGYAGIERFMSDLISVFEKHNMVATCYQDDGEVTISPMDEPDGDGGHFDVDDFYGRYVAAHEAILEKMKERK